MSSKTLSKKQLRNAKHNSYFKFRYSAHLDVDFKLKSEVDGGKPNGIFSIKPDKMHLGIDETRDLSLYALPAEVEKYEDGLVCIIDKNPKPVEFAISCLGAKPYVIVAEETEVNEDEEKGKKDKDDDSSHMATLDVGSGLAGKLLFATTILNY